MGEATGGGAGYQDSVVRGARRGESNGGCPSRRLGWAPAIVKVIDSSSTLGDRGPSRSFPAGTRFFGVTFFILPSLG